MHFMYDEWYFFAFFGLTAAVSVFDDWFKKKEKKNEALIYWCYSKWIPLAATSVLIIIFDLESDTGQENEMADWRMKTHFIKPNIQ